METTTRISAPKEDMLSTLDRNSTSFGYSINPLSADSPSFSALDYCLFSAMLAFSGLIGVYFGFCAKQKQNTTSEYLMGGKSMGLFPVSMSLIASCISGITLMGSSAEMYNYGTHYCTTFLGLFIASVISGICFLPIFYKLQLNTSYEYLELRFDRRVRILGSLLFLISNVLYIPIVIYVPALAFSQVTGVNLHLITPLVCIVCIFYTSLGGLKAVVWTDTLQTVMMLGAMITVVWIGTNGVGSFQEVWEINDKSGRIEFFNFHLDPTIRHTIWNTVFGSTFGWLTGCSVNQAMVQRFLAMSTIKRAQIMLVIFCFGVILIASVSFYAGLVIYATYYECDLVSTKIVKAADQILPYFVMETSRSVPGLPGLFMAGVFSAALSTMSTGLNSMAGVIYEDFIDPCLKVKLSEARASFLMKIICVVIGVFCVAMVFVVENLGGVVQVSWSLAGVTLGPLMAIFTLGTFFPWTNAKGTLIGGIIGLIVMGYICFGNQIAISSGKIKYEKKPVTTEGCTFLNQSSNYTFEAITDSSPPSSSLLMQTTVTPPLLPEEEEAMWLFRISYTLFTLIGLVVTTAAGLVASALTGPTDPADVHIDLLTPVIRPLYAHRCKGGDVKGDRNVIGKTEDIKEQDEIHKLLKTPIKKSPI